MEKWTAVALALALVAAPLSAQHQDHGQGQQQAGMGMQGAMGPLTGELAAYAPDRLLEMKGMLALTAEQVARLTAIRDSAKAVEEGAHAAAHTGMMALRAALAVEGTDAETLRQYFMAHHAGMGNVQWGRAAAALQARALLTSAQRTHVEHMKAGH